MKRARMIAAGAVAALTLGVGAGFAAAQNDPTPTTTPAVGMPGMQQGGMNAMHAQMRSDMPDDLQAQCDAMHTSMQGQMGTGMGGMSDMGGMRGSMAGR